MDPIRLVKAIVIALGITGISLSIVLGIAVLLALDKKPNTFAIIFGLMLFAALIWVTYMFMT